MGRGRDQTLASSASTSCSVGMDGAVPGRVTEMPATAQVRAPTLAPLLNQFADLKWPEV